jgi:uncharacterized damage-inducible protein DinB
VTEELAELHRFNAWANRNLLAGVGRLEPELLDQRRPHMYDTIRGVLVHAAQVELAYLRMIRGEERERLGRELELAEIARRLDETGAGLTEVAGQVSEPSWEARRVRIPWFDRDLSVRQWLRQVLTHSANHRADVNGWLPELGVESTDQDYIDLVLGEG